MTQNFTTLLPSNKTKFEVALEESSSAFENLPVEKLIDIWNPSNCPNEFLLWLAETLSVEIFEKDWPEWRKRRILKYSLDIHFRKGTRYAVRFFLELLGFRFNIIEWFEATPPKAPYTFEVHFFTDDPDFFAKNGDLIDRAIENTKPVRTGYIYSQILGIPLQNEILFGAICSAQKSLHFTANISPIPPKKIDFKSSNLSILTVGTVQHNRKFIANIE